MIVTYDFLKGRWRQCIPFTSLKPTCPSLSIPFGIDAEVDPLSVSEHPESLLSIPITVLKSSLKMVFIMVASILAGRT